jgi:hypothetical protein
MEKKTELMKCAWKDCIGGYLFVRNGWWGHGHYGRFFRVKPIGKRDRTFVWQWWTGRNFVGTSGYAKQKS